MDKKTQRIVSIVIGLILAGLLLYIGFRIVQQRASRASVPESFTASRVDIDTCRISASTLSDEPLLVRYGETSPTFYYRMESSNITPQADGTYLQEADVNNLGDGSITFLVENHEDISTICEPFTGSAGGDDTDDSLSGFEGTGDLTEPTEVPVEDDDIEEVVEVISLEALTLDQAEAFFENNPNDDVIDCTNEFKDDYISFIQPCNAAWRAL